MHDDLINALRHCAECDHQGCAQDCRFGKEHPLNFICIEYLQREAADAIEELAAFKSQITDGHFYCMRDGILYEAKLNPPKAKSIKLPPIKFAEPSEEE